ncbi:hypothetical protein V8C34DRAFT_268860 [Trichoderma compactum]
MAIASIKSGGVPLDPNSMSRFKGDKLFINFYQQHKDLWSKTAKLSEFLGREDEFDAIYHPGGHGPAFDFAFDKDSHALIVEFLNNGRLPPLCSMELRLLLKSVYLMGLSC